MRIGEERFNQSVTICISMPEQDYIRLSHLWRDRPRSKVLRELIMKGAEMLDKDSV